MHMEHQNLETKNDLIRLDVLMVKVYCFETKEQVVKRAQELSRQIAKTRGWSRIRVKISNVPTVADGQRVCYFFEVWGETSSKHLKKRSQ